MIAAVSAIWGCVRAMAAFHTASQLYLGSKISLEPLHLYSTDIYRAPSASCSSACDPSFLPCTKALVSPSLPRAEESRRQDFQTLQWGSKGITGTSGYLWVASTAQACESMQAGSQNSHKTVAQMQRIIYFITLATRGSQCSTWVETQKWECQHCRAQSIPAVGTHLPRTNWLPPCSDLPVLFMLSELGSPFFWNRKKGLLSLSERVMSAERFSFSKQPEDEQQSRSWHSQLQGHSANLPSFYPFPHNTKWDYVHKAFCSKNRNISGDLGKSASCPRKNGFIAKSLYYTSASNFFLKLLKHSPCKTSVDLGDFLPLRDKLCCFSE